MAGFAFTPGLLRLAQHGERLVYRIAGLPVAVAALFAVRSVGESSPLDSAFTAQYWHLDGIGDSKDACFHFGMPPCASRSGRTGRSRIGS